MIDASKEQVFVFNIDDVIRLATGSVPAVHVPLMVVPEFTNVLGQVVDELNVPLPPWQMVVPVVTGGAITVISTVDTVAEQGPAPSGSLVVSVSVTVPLVMLGV